MSGLFPKPDDSHRRKSPWEKKRKENAHAFDLFEHYLHSEQRSLEATAAHYSTELEYVSKLYKENDWESRALAYEHDRINREIDIQILRPEDVTMLDMHEKHFKIAEYAENIAIKGLYFIDQYITDAQAAKQSNLEPPKPPPLTAEQVLKVADFATKLKRLTLGAAGTITEHKTTVDYSRLSDDELKKLKELADKTKSDNSEDDDG